MDPEVNERFERIENKLETLVDVVTTLAQVATQHEEEIAEIRRIVRETSEQMKHTDESLGVLIRMMDEWIRKNPRDGTTR